MKHKEITHRMVEKLMFWSFLVFFPLMAGFCFAFGMPDYLWQILLAMPAVLAVFTFVPFLNGAPQAYMAAVCMMTAATLYMWENKTLASGYGVLLMIMSLTALYRRIGLNVLQMVYITLLYGMLYLFYPERFFHHLENPFSAVLRLVMLYIGGVSILVLIRWFRSATAIMESRAGSITELYGMVEQEKRNAETRSREKADFLANVSHEMRTPMIAVCGMSELLLQNELTPLEEEYVTTIQNSANNLLTLVNDVLDYSKIEANMMELEEQPYSVEGLLSDVAGIINVRLGEKNVAFVTDVAPDIPAELIGDESRLRQILINLLNNAVKFTDSGMIRLSLSCNIDENARFWLRMDVTDTGIGITREDQKKLFTQFTQVDTDHNRRAEGSGLGLLISQRLTNKMNGTISVESEYGKGSTFTAVVEQKVKKRRELGFVPDPDGHIAYICEPDEYYRENLRTMLEHLGIAVVVINDIAVWDYYNADRFGSVLFFDYSSCIAAVNSFAVGIKRLRLVSLIDRSAFVDDGVKENIIILHKPVLTGQLASVLRGETLDTFHKARKHENHLFIPDAKILVVDDNYVNLRVTAGLLNVYKPHIEMVSSGREAYDAVLRDQSYDMIFMDHIMPDWDGIETVRRIRAIDGDYYKKVPIIALSSNVGEAAREMFLSSGMNDFVEKPMRGETLAAVIRKYIPENMQLSEYTGDTDSLMNVSRSRGEYISDKIKYDAGKINIPGLNVPQGIFNMGGSVESYNQILGVFLGEGRKQSELLRKYGEARSVKDYRIQAHSLKSVLASIGATELSQLARDHENAAKQGDESFIAEHYPELAEKYDVLLDSVEEYLKSMNPIENEAETTDSASVKQPISSQKKRADVAVIRKLIEDFDSDGALEAINELLSFKLSEEDREALQHAVGCLGNYDYDGALQAVSGI